MTAAAWTHRKMFRIAFRAACHRYSPATFLFGAAVRLQNRQLNIHEYQVSFEHESQRSTKHHLWFYSQRLLSSNRAPRFWRGTVSAFHLASPVKRRTRYMPPPRSLDLTMEMSFWRVRRVSLISPQRDFFPHDIHPLLFRARFCVREKWLRYLSGLL